LSTFKIIDPTLINPDGSPVKDRRWGRSNHALTHLYKPDGYIGDNDRMLTIYSPHSAIANKYFTITNCTRRKPIDTTCYLTFTLTDPEGVVINWKVLDYELPVLYAHFKGYIDKMKLRYEGKELYLLPKNYLPEYGSNFLTREKYVYRHDGYRCLAVNFVKAKYGVESVPCLILKDKTGTVIAVPLGKRNNPDGDLPALEDFCSKATWDSLEAVKKKWRQAAESKSEEKRDYKALVRKFGATDARLIMDDDVRLGMSMAACKESWGEPAHMTKAETKGVITETWLYEEHRWLKFTNGVLKAFGK
jgi:hypothetical protein